MFEYCPWIRGKGLRCGSRNPFSMCSKRPLAARGSCFRANFAGCPTLFFQILFSLESARFNNSMSVGACAVVDIGLWKYVKVFSGHSAGQHPRLDWAAVPMKEKKSSSAMSLFPVLARIPCFHIGLVSLFFFLLGTVY